MLSTTGPTNSGDLTHQGTDEVLRQVTAELARMRAELDESTRLATHDALTGLPNRRTITERLASAIERSEGRGVAVMFIDVDRFKVINDLYGHEVGDQVLCEVAGRLRAAVGESGEVGRLGGDEFVVVVHQASRDRLVTLASRVLEWAGPTIDIGHRVLPLTLSIGVAPATGSHTAAQLLDRADAAMYRAKRSGRDAVVHFDEHMERELSERAALERELTSALQDGQLAVHYQPTIELGSGRIIGFEALVRWNHPERGILPASRFVPLAEDVGEVWAIDAFVLSESGRCAAQWQQIDQSLRDLIMSVNLSAQQFRDQAVVRTISDAVERSGVPASTFQLEIAETVVTDSRSGDPVAVLGELHDLGVRLAMDNFGTGSSSLACLKQLPLDVLNIDRRFIAGLGTCRDDDAIVHAILRLAESFRVDAVAEGVETRAQLDWLRDAGCRLGQGYHFSRPLTHADAEALLRERCCSQP